MSRTLKFTSFLIMLSLLLSIFGFPAVNHVYALDATKTDRVIVSMGDSYSSGEGIEPYYGSDITSLEKKVKNQDWIAHRSTKSWPGQLSLDSVGNMSDEGNKDTHWYFVATSGAVTHDIENDKYDKNYCKSVGTGKEGAVKGSTKIDAQINVFNKIKDKGQTVDYVTLTLGGNDVGFSNVIISALNPGDYLFPNNLYAQFHYLLEDGGIDKVLNNLEESYDAISKAAGEQAHIIVAGYPKLFDDNGKGFFVRKDSANVINDAVGIFNNRIEELVKKKQNEDKMNIHFVSVEKAFKGKGAYSKNAYIEGIRIPTIEDLDDWGVGGASFHPNEKGARAYAGCVQAEIDRLEGKTPKSRPKPTEKPTDKPVQIPTHKPTEKKEYTAVELASKSLDEIKDLMGGKYKSEHIQLSNAFSSSGTSYVYNYDVFPGLAFETYDDDYHGISIMDGAKLNEQISSDMTYNQITDVIGGLDGMLVGQGYNIACSTTVDGYSVTFCFIENDYLKQYENLDGKFTSDILRKGNPQLQSIGLRREPENTQSNDKKAPSSLILKDYFNYSFDELSDVFGDSYSNITLPESGYVDCVAYDSLPDVGFGLSNDEKKVKLIGVKDSSQSVNFTNDITSSMTGSELLALKNKYTVSETYSDVNESYYVIIRSDDGWIISFEWWDEKGKDYKSTSADFIAMQYIT